VRELKKKGTNFVETHSMIKINKNRKKEWAFSELKKPKKVK
jgi:hypothetical protein